MIVYDIIDENTNIKIGEFVSTEIPRKGDYISAYIADKYNKESVFIVSKIVWAPSHFHIRRIGCIFNSGTWIEPTIFVKELP